jgi:Flp pilus assembly pilin Flp
LISNPARARRQQWRDQRGAVVVEAALVIALFLVPMVLGVLTFGYKLWQLQKYDPYEPRIYASQVVGVFDCTGLLDRVKNTVRTNISGLGVPVDLSWIDAVVIESDATGVLVDVTVTVPYPDGSGDAAVLKSATRLENVELTAVTC